MIEDRWTADESFIFEDSGIITNIDYRNYYKINKGKAIIVIASAYKADGTPVTTPCIVSTNPDYVKSYCSYNTNYIASFSDSLNYQGLTWYFCEIPYGFLSHYTYVLISGFAKVISINALWEAKYRQDILLEILKAANVRLLYSQSIKNSIKDKILNNKLFQEHCLPYKEE